MKTKKNDKRKRIIEAAIRIFARNGYFNSRVSDIAKEAGIADGTIYIYFKSKDEILSAIFDETLQKFIENSREQVAAVDNPAGKLEKIAFLHLHYLGMNRDLAIVFQIEFRHNILFMEEISKTKLDEYFTIIHNSIEMGQKQGLFKEIHPRFASKLFFGMIDELVTNWLISKRDYKLEDSAAQIADLFVFGIEKR